MILIFKNTYLTPSYNNIGSNLYMIAGYMNNQNHFFSVNSYSKRIVNIGNLEE